MRYIYIFQFVSFVKVISTCMSASAVIPIGLEPIQCSLFAGTVLRAARGLIYLFSGFL